MRTHNYVVNFKSSDDCHSWSETLQIKALDELDVMDQLSNEMSG